MKSLVAKGISTIQNDGLKVFFLRLWNYNLVKIKRTLRGKNKKNIQRWADLKDKYKGERVFIIGNAPSLNQMPLYFLKNEYTMAFNRFNLMFERMDWLPQFYMVCDDLVLKDMYAQINTEILPHVEYAFFPDIHPSNVEFDKFIDHKENVYWLNTDRPEFRADLPKCGINKTVVNAGIQAAAFLGFSEIYLIGVDMSFADQKVKKSNSRDWEAAEHDPNHFDPRYFGKGLKYHNPTVHEMLEKFDLCQEFFSARGVKIFNAGVGGKLEAFPRVNFESLFNYDQEKTEAFLQESKVLKEHGLTFDDMQKAPLVEQLAESYPQYFKTSQELGVTLISKIILEYLPVGPYKQQYFFVKR